MLVQATQKYVDYIKWRIFSHTSSEESGKNNNKKRFFRLGLKYTLRTAPLSGCLNSLAGS